jgi:hypothetical protein
MCNATGLSSKTRMGSNTRLVCCVVCLILLLAAACAGMPGGGQTNVGEELCHDPWEVAEEFYRANDEGDFDASLKLLTDDVALVTWATGANGYHVSARFAIGKNQVLEWLGEPGMRRAAVNPERPNFQEANRRSLGNTLSFELMPDRLRENGRPFNHYSVKLVFKGCKIEIIKLVERVTWL